MNKEVNTWILTNLKVNYLDNKAFLLHSKNIYLGPISSQKQILIAVLKVNHRSNRETTKNNGISHTSTSF
jgi:hypothetical protein